LCLRWDEKSFLGLSFQRLIAVAHPSPSILLHM
jgi:hypothetical protein